MIAQIIKNGIGIPARTLHEVLGKATEELGEVATIVNKPTKEHAEPLQAEVIDVVNAVVDLAWLEWLQKMGVDHSTLTLGNYEGLMHDFAKEMYAHQEVKLAKWTKNYLLHCRKNDETEAHTRAFKSN